MSDYNTTLIAGKPVQFLFSSAEVAAMEIADTQFYLEPFIPKEGIAFLHGKWGSYKTPIILAMAKAIAGGHELWGIEPEQASPILILELDTPKGTMLHRFQKAIEPDSNIDYVMGYHGSVNFVNPDVDPVHRDMVEKLRYHHRQKNYKVVFIDSARCTHNLPEKDSETVHRVFGAVMDVFRGAALVFIHHDRKTQFDKKASEELQDEDFSGSQAWANHATVGIHVTKNRDVKNQISLKVTKSQAAEQGEPLKLEVYDGWDVRLAGEAMLNEVAAILAGLPPGLSAKDQDVSLAKALGTSERTARRRRTDVLRVKELLDRPKLQKPVGQLQLVK